MMNRILARKTKIVCTIGPASDSPDKIRALVAAGMNVARLNFSHGDHAGHQAVLDALREAAREAGRPVGALMDLGGPKIRLGVLPQDVTLRSGQEVELAPENMASGAMLPVQYEHLLEDVEVGQSIMLADGLVELRCTAKSKASLRCQVISGGVVSSRKGVNLPTSDLRVPAFTEKDRRDLEMGLKAGVDFVGVSFVRHERDIEPVREMTSQLAEPPLIIAKIEKPQAVDHLTQILSVVDGVMVARGDLGVEMPLEQVPIIQKRIIDQARRAGKVVITATQMLRSMIDSPRPTRAEANDVANAVLDGTDAVMLSEESAVGRYPIKAVEVMSKICRATESLMDKWVHLREEPSHLLPSTEAALSRAACFLAKDLQAAAIVASTSGGGTARLISRFRPVQPIMGLTPNMRTLRQLTMSWGVIPGLVPKFDNTEAMFRLCHQFALEHGIADSGDRLIVTAGIPLHQPGTTNMIKVMQLE